MRWLLATALALAAVRGAHADPAAPQVSPQPGRREDAQRLREQLRSLDREPAPGTAGATAAPADTAPPAPAAAPTGRPAARIAGIVMLTISGVAALTTVSLFASTPSDAATAASYDTPKLAFGLTTALSAVAGFILLAQSRPVQVAPTVTSRSVGLAISGRL